MRFLLPGLSALCLAAPAYAGFISVDDYLSQADIPLGFYAGDAPVFLEDFEDGTLDGGITFDTGVRKSGIFGPGEYRDSVDGDDGDIDGSGQGGHAFFVDKGSLDNGIQGGILFSFASAVTAAGIAYTDGSGSAKLVAYDLAGDVISFGGQTFATGGSLDPSSFKGQTAEDTFLGVSYDGGISAIRVLAGTSNGLEVDHLQYGVSATLAAVPGPASAVLLIGGIAGLGLMRRRAR